jgi:hypothetical protein
MLVLCIRAAAAEPKKPPLAGAPDCATAAQYRSATNNLLSAEKAHKSGDYAQSLAFARRGINVLGYAYLSRRVPLLDDTGQHLVLVDVLLRDGKAKTAAEEAIGVLRDRLDAYFQAFGDPAKLCR